MTAGERLCTGGEVFDPFPIQFVGHTNLKFVEFVQHIELGDGQAIKAVHTNGIASDHTVEPTAAPAAAGGGAELTTSVAEMIVEAAIEFGGEWPFSNSGCVGLGHTDHPVDQGRPHASPNAGTA